MPRLYVFMGPMYSGKTSEMLRAVRAARQSGAFTTDDGVRKLTVARSRMDTRSPPGAVVSRDGLEERGEHVLVVDSLDELEVVPGGMVACDEAQFFGDGSLLRLWERVAAQQGALLVSGLDRDFRGRPFGDVLALSRLHLGDAAVGPGAAGDALVEVRRLVSRCAVCGSAGALTARVSGATPAWLEEFGPGKAGRSARCPHEPSAPIKSQQVVVGDRETYRAVCSQHHAGGLLVRATADPESPLLGSADGAVLFHGSGERV